MSITTGSSLSLSKAVVLVRFHPEFQRRFAERLAVYHRFIHKAVQVGGRGVVREVLRQSVQVAAHRQPVQAVAVGVVQAVEAAPQRGTVLAVRQAVQAARQAAVLAGHAPFVFDHPADGLDALVDGHELLHQLHVDGS